VIRAGGGNLREGFQIGVSGADESCDYMTFSGRKAEWNMRAMKSFDEVACAKRLCDVEYPDFPELTKQPTDSPVDVCASSHDANRHLQFQVTSVWDKDFWRPFGDAGEIENRVSFSQFVNFIRESIQKKIQRHSSSRDVILLIDTKPADLPAQCLTRLREDEHLRRELSVLPNFSQIWVVDANGNVRLK
jgi:hypothetical protein